MNYLRNTQPSPVLSSVAVMVREIQRKLNAHYEENLPHMTPPQVVADVGEVFVRVYHHNITLNSEWAVCFIMLDTGNIRMPLGLRAYDRYNIGNVTDYENGFNLITDEGLVKPDRDVPTSYDPNYKDRKAEGTHPRADLHSVPETRKAPEAKRPVLERSAPSKPRAALNRREGTKDTPVVVKRKRTYDLPPATDMSPEAELARQRAYGREMRDD